MRWCAFIMVAVLLLLCVASASSLLQDNFALLESLGIEIPGDAKDAISKQIDDILSTMPDEIRDDYGYDRDSFSDITTILAWLGYGETDYETWITTPYTDDVYAFDSEMYDIEGAYLDLLDAVERLSGGGADIDNCEVQISEELFLQGTGEFPIVFTLNGRECRYMAELQTDWMDCEIIDYLNRILKDQGIDKRIWSMYDGGQGLVIFYDDDRWAAEFERVTGCGLDCGTGSNLTIEGFLDFFR